MSNLYIVSESETGPIKVGISKYPRSRLASLQTGNPRPLKLLECWSFEEASEAERMLLDELSKFAMSGEWLDLDEAFIRDYMPDFFLANGWEARAI